MAERFPGDDKRRVLEATDLVRLIGEHVALKRKGREWACICPFHDDHNPSMYVVPHKQIYHCFVCGAGGDAISFVMNFHKMEFREALHLLADRAGIELAPPPTHRVTAVGPDAGDEGNLPVASRELLLRANRLAQEFFQAILGHAEHGKAARSILDRRGVSAEMIAQFGIGAAPARWDGLIATLARRGIDGATLAAAGLAKARDTSSSAGGYYDVMRHRITFPIHDALGRVIAFGGRRIDDADEPKYLNSPETLLFNKSATLYGLHHAAPAIRERNRVIVTEGYMDCIACHQAGIRHAVATLGTALTPLGGRVLRRQCEQVVLLFDGDDAGQRAADRAIEVLFAEPIELRIAVMSSAPPESGQPIPKDPDELLKQPRGRERFESMISVAVEALEYRFTRLHARLAGQSLAGRSRVIDDEIARLAELGMGRISPVRRHMIVRRVAGLAGVPERVVAESMARCSPRLVERANVGGVGSVGGEGGATEKTGADAGEPILGGLKHMTVREQMLACALCECTLLDQLAPEERALLLSAGGEGTEGTPRARQVDDIARVIAELVRTGKSFAVQDILSRLADAGAVRIATGMVAGVDIETEGLAERLARTWEDCLRRWRAILAEQTRPADPLALAVRVVHDRRQHGADQRRMPRRSR